MGQAISYTDFRWTYSEQPHLNRRAAIVQKYPQVKQLFGVDPSLKFVVASCVIMQTAVAYLLRGPFFSWLLILMQAYFFGGLVNHGLALAIHDISHNTVFGNNHPLKNRFFGMFANLPIGLPISVSFKKYHVEHHRYLSEQGLDTDLPTEFEAKFFCNPVRKAVWICLQPLFYGIRPLLVYRKYPCDLEVINFVVQMAYNIAILWVCGWRSLLYLVGGTLLGMGMHPAAAHYVAEHYAFTDTQETYSYYGPWNLVLYNVGYHVEHHDFPYVPGRNLPKLRQIAPEFYDHLHHHVSYLDVLWYFVFSPAMGPYKRIKRAPSVPQDPHPYNALVSYLRKNNPLGHWLDSGLVKEWLGKQR